eukprot:11505030-Alexandrium_andersonii.AAC.1
MWGPAVGKIFVRPLAAGPLARSLCAAEPLVFEWAIGGRPTHSERSLGSVEWGRCGGSGRQDALGA